MERAAELSDPLFEHELLIKNSYKVIIQPEPFIPPRGKGFTTTTTAVVQYTNAVASLQARII